MPEDTVWPFLLSLSILVICYGLVTGVLWLGIAGVMALLVTIAGWFWPQPSMTPAGGEV